MSKTTYTIRDRRGLVDHTNNPENAERLSRAGYRVTAKTEGE